MTCIDGNAVLHLLLHVSVRGSPDRSAFESWEPPGRLRARQPYGLEAPPTVARRGPPNAPNRKAHLAQYFFIKS